MYNDKVDPTFDLNLHTVQERLSLECWANILQCDSIIVTGNLTDDYGTN